MVWVSKIEIDQSGFTILELLIASLVFSAILLIVTFGVIEVTREYIKGSVSSGVQNADRSIMDRITQAIQTTSPTLVDAASTNTIGSYNGSPTPAFYFCVGSTIYIYEYEYNSPSAFVEGQTSSGCPNPTAPGDAPTYVEDLLSSNTQILPPPNGTLSTPIITPSTTITNSTTTATLYTITLSLLYGSQNTYNSNHLCNSIVDGGSFCASSTTTTAVESRSSIG